MCEQKAMFSQYFDDWEVKPEFEKEAISLWSNWLGEANLYKLDEVTENEWARFNSLLTLIANKYEVGLADCDSESISKLEDIEAALPSYLNSVNKDASQFLKYVIPELDCVLTEEWDYTYILWHKKNGALEALAPLIAEAGLYHFHA